MTNHSEPRREPETTSSHQEPQQATRRGGDGRDARNNHESVESAPDAAMGLKPAGALGNMNDYLDYQFGVECERWGFRGNGMTMSMRGNGLWDPPASFRFKRLQEALDRLRIAAVRIVVLREGDAFSATFYVGERECTARNQDLLRAIGEALAGALGLAGGGEDAS